MLDKKAYLTIISIVLFLVSNSQEKDIGIYDTKISYELTFKKNTTSKKITALEAILYTNDKKESFFTLKNMISIDSIQSKRDLELNHVKKYNTPINFIISKEASIVTHYEKIGLDILTYEEEIKLNWSIEKDSKNINGYECEKASIDFGGRKWIAWYAVDIPIDSGPYKFHGLPGLILEIADSEGIFKFEALQVSKDKYHINNYVSNYFITDNKKYDKVKKSYFFNLKDKFYSLSVSERLNYITKNKEEIQNFVISDANGNKLRSNSRNIKRKNFIEKI